MAKYNFNLKEKAMIDEIRSPAVYNFNMACNLALLSNDTSVIRRFFQVGVAKYFKDQWLTMQVADTFLGHYEPGQAFAYFGIMPMIVQGKVNLIASNGFKCKSDDPMVDLAINKAKDIAELEKKFVEGAYWESGIGDFAYRISYDPELSEYPIIDVIEPQHLEINYSHGKIKSFVIKEASSEDPTYELCEIHHKDAQGYACINYRFRKDGKYVPLNDESLIKECRAQFADDLKLEPQRFPIKGFMIVYKQNENNSMLYKGERGVPDIQGLLSIEDALTETVSDLIDAIRKGGIKQYVSEELIPQDENGRTFRFDPFRKTIMITRGSTTPGEGQNLITTVQANINWEAYTRTIQNLMSVAINKAGLAPTTLGLTGLESINSSAESQDAREKTSLRKREICLNGWTPVLKELLNKWLQVYDYVCGLDIIDYTDLINIQFNEYTNPSLESITDVLARQVNAGIKAQETAISELNDGWSDEQVQKEIERIRADRQGIQVIDKNLTETDDVNFNGANGNG